MKMLLGLGLFFVAAASIYTAENSAFTVDLINPSRAYLLVDDAWQRNAECLQVKVSVSTDVSDPVLKAYFYGADGKLLNTEKSPSRQTNDEGNETKPQMKFEKTRKYEFYFGIPVAAKNWKRAIIVFGKPGDYATRVYPKDDLAKFDFPEKASVAVAAAPVQAIVPVQEKATVPTKERATVRGKPIPEVQALKDPFDAQVNSEVEQVYDAGVKDLNQKYILALERAQEKAQEAAKLEEAVAIKADKEAVADGKGVPATDDGTTPAVLKQLRSTYRQAIGRMEAERLRKLQPLQVAFIKSLDALVISLTKEGKLEEAMAVKSERESLADAFTEPAPTTLGLLREAPTPTPTDAKGDPLVNSLGMKFVPVPGTEVLMCIHETRRKDYAAFASTNSRTDDGWKQAEDQGMPVSRGDEDPVVMVNLDDATAFCAWLSKKEGKVYRLPTDREWSMAVGIGERESASATPLALNEKIRDEFPWGKQWPPPKGSVNLRDSTYGKRFPADKRVSNVEDYSDGFVMTAPVMSFAPNNLGIYDLGGNVREWCSDWFEKDKGTHVVRGGSYGSIRGGVLSSYRIGGSTARSAGIGFRCVVVSQNMAVTSKPTEALMFTIEQLTANKWKFHSPQIRSTPVYTFNPEKTLASTSGAQGKWSITGNTLRIDFEKAWSVYSLELQSSTGPLVLKQLDSNTGNRPDTTLTAVAGEPSAPSASAKAPELPWLIGKTWSTDAGNTLEFSTGGSGERTTKSGKTPFTWQIMPSGLVEVVLKASPPMTLYVEIKSASDGVFGYSENNRTTTIHVK